MKDEFELEILPGGKIRTIYQEGIEEFAEEIGATVSSVCRLSHVEWEDIGGVKGWTVRAAHDRELALRYSIQDGQRIIQPSREGSLVFYINRPAALEAEAQFVWALLPPKAEDGS